MFGTVALLVSLATSTPALIEDHYVEPSAYATEVQKVILRKWVLPEAEEYQQNNTITPEHVAGIELLPIDRQPVRIGRAECCIIG